MKRRFQLLIASSALAATLLFTGSALAQAPAKSTKTAAPKTSDTTKPTAAQIADAKSKGMVWVNTSTKVYHKDGEYYGNTAHGKFMTEADAQKAGYKAAQTTPAPKAKSTKK
jgi:hypothetical protein